MRLFAVLTEELESRPDDADRVLALARYLREVGPGTGTLAGEWLVAAARRVPARRPARLTLGGLGAAAATLAEADGTPPWLFEVGREASTEAAEAIALLLPWPPAAAVAGAGIPGLAPRPPLADWMVAWSAAASTDGAAERARAIAWTIAALDDPFSRRWAVRAVCGLAKPVVGEWQWQRAWAAAFGEDARGVAWRWHRGTPLHRPGESARERGADSDRTLPRPRDFVALPEAPGEAHAALQAAWHLDEYWAEPRWRGLRVQIVRQGGHVAAWQREGGLLNDLLPAALLAAVAWPDPCVIEAVLVGWHAGRAVAISDALAAAAPTGRRKTASDAVPAGPTLHLVLVDWRRWAEDEGATLSATQRRVRLQAHWPAPDADAAAPPGGPEAAAGADSVRPPAVFTTPMLRAPHSPADPRPAEALLRFAAASRDAGWSGVVLRRVDARSGHPPPAGAVVPAWAVRAPVHRVRAVLQYVPSEGLGASAAALGFVACGFAVWNRSPRSADEQNAAMTAAMAGEFLPPPADAPDLSGLRLLPLARTPLALPEDELQRLHAWLRANAGQRFGAVHAVAPALVFELGFTGLRESRRHRLGAVIDDARVLRWLVDAPPGSAQRAQDLDANPWGGAAGLPGRR